MATVGSSYVLHQCQSQPCSGSTFGIGVRDAIEPFEDTLLLVGGDSDAAIRHLNQSVSIFRPEAEFDIAYCEERKGLV